MREPATAIRLKITDRVVRALCVVATVIAVIPLLSVLIYVTGKGLAGLSWSFFTSLPQPVGEPGGGMANAIVGTLELVALASLIGVPFGVLAGIYLAEFGDGRLARVVRFSADVMTGVPSIVVGIFVYTVFVLTMRRFSMIAGAVSLAIIMLPVVTRTTEELLRLVPDSLREAALALGVPRWRAILRVVVRTAAPGIATGVMLAVARVAGETAPLLFTAFNNRFWNEGLTQPVASMPVQIFNFAVAPYDDWHRQAWAGALTLVALVLLLNLGARLLVRHRVGGVR
jgi:phosphate transport system permease protein